MSGARSAAVLRDESVVWHDVECGGYAADLELWRTLAEAGAGTVLELGAGTGRVALDLAARGHEVHALDSDPALVRELARRARERGLRVRAEAGDARTLELGRSFALIVAPMQVVQLLGGAGGRRSLLRACHRHLEPGGILAAALADPLEGIPAGDALPPLPDVRQQDGWVFSSRPVAVRDEGGAIAIDRAREAVSPDGAVHASASSLLLDRVSADHFTRDAAGAGFRTLPLRRVPETDGYVGSDVVVLEAVR